jgi:hypothetical protein
VIVNVAARELALGSGGFDIVHVNLTRGLDGPPTANAHVMKLNYTSLQHAVHALEASVPEQAGQLSDRTPVAVIALHTQLAPLAWAFAAGLREVGYAGSARLGYVQTDGGSLPGSHSNTVRELRARDLLATHITAGAAYGGADGDAMTTAGALAYGFGWLRWDAAVCGPGPGIIGSGSRLGHGGLAALDSAHAALALGARTLLVPRMSSGDPRPTHRPLSHHTRTVLELLLREVIVAMADGEEIPLARDRHDWRRHSADLEGYAASGLPATVMGRSLSDDPVFFTTTLAGGGVLAELVAEASRS